jgi:hypothetical protein
MPRPTALKLLRVTLPGLSSQQGRPCLAVVTDRIIVATHRTTAFPLPLTKVCAQSSSFRSTLLCPSAGALLCRVIQIYIVRQVVRSQVIAVGRLSSGLPLQRGSSASRLGEIWSKFCGPSFVVQVLCSKLNRTDYGNTSVTSLSSGSSASPISTRSC